MLCKDKLLLGLEAWEICEISLNISQYILCYATDKNNITFMIITRLNYFYENH